MSASAVGTALIGGPDSARRAPRQLSPAAVAAASEATRSAYSPIVVAGFVRAIESTLIALVGTLIYCFYVVWSEGFSWPYVWAIAGITVQFDDRVSGGRHLPDPCVPPSAESAGAADLGLVAYVPVATAVSFFFKFDQMFSRVWLLSFWAVGLVALLVFRTVLYTFVRRWMRDGRLTRRTVIVGGGDVRRGPDPCAGRAKG